MRRATLGMLLLVLSGYPSYATALDLNAAYQLALRNDPVLAQAQARQEATQTKPAQARAGLLPNLSLSGGAFANQQKIEQQGSFERDRHFGSYSYALNLTQPLVHVGNWTALAQSELQANQGDLTLAAARQDLILRTAQAYFEQLQAQERLAAAQAYLQAVNGQLNTTREAFRIGTGVKTDMFDAETRSQLAQTQQISSENELQLKQRKLANITGQFEPQLYGIRPGFEWPLDKLPGLEQWLAAGQANFQLQIDQLNQQIAEWEIQRQQAQHYPTVDLIATAGRNSDLSSGLREWTDNQRIGIQVSVPLYQGGEVAAKTTEAAANARAATHALENTRRSVELEIRQAYWQLTQGVRQIASLRLALRAARDAEQTTRDAFAIGVRFNLDVLNAQTQVFNTQSELIRISTDTLLAWLKLKAMTAQLSEVDVQAINAFLQPSTTLKQ
ncbi:TolC family outer membrane protein [Chitinibacter tainanensis]|uniref:TolC family outer membrane protein n=1 Tax=Chitinibacter tainanensis TaxID=230667 RepID=UPI00048D7826|nr:TolC family outer membrane protein [Chitinibacter tainanensis]